jgi:cytochrome b6-f complex iron-sulfur subunit
MPKPFWRRAFPLDLHEESRYSRREFARFLAVVSAGFTAGIGYLWGRKRPLEGAPDEEDMHVEPVPLEDAGQLKVGQSRLFTFRDADDRCILLRTPEGHLRAFRQTCTHLGCAVRFDGQRLECPCHMGYFEPDKGFPVQGPPTRPLAGIALEIGPDGRVRAVGDLPKPTELRAKEV